MAKIPINLFKKWVDGDTIKAVDYQLERDTLVTALNDTDEKTSGVKPRVDVLEEEIVTKADQLYVDVMFSVVGQKFDTTAYLVSPSGFKFQFGVNDDGSLYSMDYVGTGTNWFNPVSPDGSKWNIMIDDDGSIDTVKIL